MSIKGKEVGKRLERLMLDNDMEQKDIAPIIGVSQSFVSRIIGGSGALQDWHLENLKKHFNINKEYFITDIEHKIESDNSESEKPPPIISPTQTTEVSELKQMVIDLLSTVKNQSESLKDYASASKYNAIDRANDSDNMKTLIKTNEYLSHKIGEMGEMGGVTKKAAGGI